MTGLTGEFDEKAESLIAEAAARAAAVMKKGDKGDTGAMGAMGAPGRDGKDGAVIVGFDPAASAVGGSIMSSVVANPGFITGTSSPKITIDPKGLGPSGIFIGPSGTITAGGGLVGEPKKTEPLELVLLPTRRPKKVLVAFFDEEDGDTPTWATYLEPEDMDLQLPEELEDAAMTLRLRLRKRFEQ